MAWVDFGQDHREDMDRLLDAFRDESTVDELGIGTVRDIFADVLFPGTSTLHTRARYLLFVSWIATSVAAQRMPLERATAELRRREAQLIESLVAGDPEGGVIGRVSRSRLKRMPSEVYWGALYRYRIRRCDEGPQKHFRTVTTLPVPPPEEQDDAPRHLHDPHFAQLPPVPDGLDTLADFALTGEEALFLDERIRATCRGSYLAWLIRNRTPEDAAYPWDPRLVADLDEDPAQVVAHARRLRHLYQGAPLLYNLLLARLKGWEEGAEDYEQRLVEWSGSDDLTRAVQEWDRSAFWETVLDVRRVNVGTRGFVDAWVDLVRKNPSEGWNGWAAAELVTEREKRLKRSRSRFLNTDALALWEGEAGVAGLHYRWANARTLVNDIRAGLER